MHANAANKRDSRSLQDTYESTLALLLPASVGGEGKRDGAACSALTVEGSRIHIHHRSACSFCRASALRSRLQTQTQMQT